MSVIFFVCGQSILKYFRTYYNYLITQHLYTNLSLGLEFKKAQTSLLNMFNSKNYAELVAKNRVLVDFFLVWQKGELALAY